MNLDKNLYFIPIIAKAFDSPNPVDSLHDAINEIITLGKLDEYNEGYKLFGKFIEVGIQTQILNSSKDSGEKDILLDKIIIMILSDDINISKEEKSEILNKIKNNPMLNKRYKKIYEEYFKQIPLEIEIYKDGNKVSSQSFEGGLKDITFRDIEPGDYIISLSNGRLLWEGQITKEDVIWEVAFPEEHYPMAAETGDMKIQSTRTEEIISGEITLSIYPGLESGRIVVKLN